MSAILIMMGWIVLVFLLGASPSLANYSASACFGVYFPCDFLLLNCTNAGYIHMLSAVYLFADAPCRNIDDKDCFFKTDKGCCKAENGKSPTNFSQTDMRKLFVACNSRQNCTFRAPRTSNGMATSSLVEVVYACKNDGQTRPENNTHADPDTLIDDGNSTTAAIVVPIVVLLLGAVAVVLFIYWRRKRQGQSKTPGIIATLKTPVQNEAYFATDKNKSVLANTADSENSGDIYHTIDPNSIPDQVAVVNKTIDPGPQDDYHMIDPNKMDYETPASHDYFILESQAATYAHNEDASEYNRIQLDTHKIVADPNYHRLGTVDLENDENYSHTAAGFHNKDLKLTIDGITENAQQNSNDDYSHLDC